MKMMIVYCIPELEYHTACIWWNFLYIFSYHIIYICSFYLYGVPNQFFPNMWWRSKQKCKLFSWRRWKDGRLKWTGWSRDKGGGADLESALLTLHLHALSLIQCLPPSLILSLSVSFSFLPHSPFILDLLSWWWWVSLHDTELSVRNTKQNWDRFSTLHRSLRRIALFLESTMLFAHSANQICFCTFVEPPCAQHQLSQQVSPPCRHTLTGI